MKKVICFDFDGVIAQYDTWKGFDVFGAPNKHVIEAMRILKERGHFIAIWTTRSDTENLRNYLKNFNIPYDSINSCAHNPPCTSQKPYYHCIVDDRAVNFCGQGTENLVGDIEKIVNNVQL